MSSLTYKNYKKWKKKPAKGGQISPFMGGDYDYIKVTLSPGGVVYTAEDTKLKFKYEDWMELPEDTPYTPGWIIKMPKIKPAIFSFKNAPGPEDVEMDVQTFTVVPPPHEMKVQSLVVKPLDGTNIQGIELITPGALGPYYLDFSVVRGMWVKQSDITEITGFDGITYATQGPMTVWWLCNGSGCCGGDDQPVDHKLTGKPPIKSVTHPPLLAVDKAPFQGQMVWATPESAEAKKERLLKESDEEVRRLAQQILEDASDVLLVDGWIKGSYHRENKKEKQSGS